MNNEEIMDKLTKICLCKAVSRATVKKAIREGATTLEEVWEKTNTGNGSCGGRQCGYKIQELIDEMAFQ